MASTGSGTVWKTAPVLLLTTLALVIMLLIGAAIVVLTGPIAGQVGKAFGIGSTAVLIWDIAKWPGLIVLVSVMVTLLYKATPNVKQPSFRWISAGGLLAGAARPNRRGLGSIPGPRPGASRRQLAHRSAYTLRSHTAVPQSLRLGSRVGRITPASAGRMSELEDQ